MIESITNRERKREIVFTTRKTWVRLTRACNNRCIFCLDRQAQDGTYIDVGSINKELKIGRKKGSKKVVLSGGEATLHPEFLKVVSTAKELGYDHIQVITNGRMFVYRGFLRAAINSGVKEITFSMHGHNSILHDAQTGVKGSFEQSLAGIKNALFSGKVIVNADIVINKLNIRYLKKIITFFINCGITEFDLLQVIPFGAAWDNRGKLFYNMDKSIKYLQEVFELANTYGLCIWTNRFPAQYLEGFEELIQHPVKLFDEINGRKEMFEIFLYDGKKIECSGVRCNYCFLKYFCLDLKEFRFKGRLYAKKPAFCLKGLDYSAVSKIRSRKVITKDKESGIIDFLKFFIENRYFVKSSRCRLCRMNVICSGAHINYIRTKGFKEIIPIK